MISTEHIVLLTGQSSVRDLLDNRGIYKDVESVSELFLSMDKKSYYGNLYY